MLWLHNRKEVQVLNIEKLVSDIGSPIYSSTSLGSEYKIPDPPYCASISEAHGTVE